MTDDNKKKNSIIPINSTDLVRVGNSIEITNKIIKEHEERLISSSIETVKIGNQAWMTKLTKSVLDSILPKEIIYAEVAGGGAMGNSGGIMLYLIKEEQLICYETSLFTDEEIYLEAEALLLRHQDRFKNENTEVRESQFDYFYGGMGNNVFINKNVALDIKEGYFSYIKNGIGYQISSSVQGVFNSVVSAMNQPKGKRL